MPEHTHERHFSIAEANGLLPKLAPLLVRLLDALKLFESQRKQAIQALEHARGNGERQHPSEVDGLQSLRRLVSEIEEFGCVIKDFEEGLLDFPALVDGREVYLCWKLGEPEIQAWHELSAGFASRRPIEELPLRPGGEE